jgi:hypothetical protein
MTDAAPEVLARAAVAVVELDTFLDSISLPESAFQIRPAEWIANPLAYRTGIRDSLLSSSPAERARGAERLALLLAACAPGVAGAAQAGRRHKTQSR